MLSSNKTSIILKCKDDNYKWKMVSWKIEKSHTFNITTYKLKNHCIKKYKQERDNHILYKYNVDKIKDNFNDIKNETSLDISYRKVFMVKIEAIKIVIRCPKDSYGKVLSFFYMLKKP